MQVYVSSPVLVVGLILSVISNIMSHDELPTLYEYFSNGGIKAGLTADNSTFNLNNNNITIYSGAMHYFRVPRQYWRDRLRKLKAAGLNTVETYVPWNLHEPEPGNFDFGENNSDFADFLKIEEFLKIAQEEDLFAIIRPGPYICSEWDFGGLPSWLLRESDMKLRTSDEKFMSYVDRYFKVLLGVLSGLQFTKGGPIIALQIENEYGNVATDDNGVDLEYLRQLKKIFINYGIVELLFTSDTPSQGNYGSLPNVLNTANFQSDTIKELDTLKTFQPNKAMMVMEYWSGWFDHWGEKHHEIPNEKFINELELILSYPSSVNFYMFHGGTNWGFLNGANVKGPYIFFDTSSYDYDAPLTEAGDFTEKYKSLQAVIFQHNKIKTRPVVQPKETQKIAYQKIKIKSMLKLTDLIDNIVPVESKELVPMELLNINRNAGQSYGYIIYRKSNLCLKENSVIKIEGRVCDTLMILINGQLVTKPFTNITDIDNFGYWKAKDATFNLRNENIENATLDLVVENFGRNNFGKLHEFNQKKGLWQGHVLIDDSKIENWQIFPLEFKTNWTNGLNKWEDFKEHNGPAIYKSELIVDEPKDTFVDMRNWKKGVVIINGFVLSRYFRIGPQQTCFLPAPFLKKGKNDLLIFEHFKSSDYIGFSNKSVFETLEVIE